MLSTLPYMRIILCAHSALSHFVAVSRDIQVGQHTLYSRIYSASESNPH